MLFNGEALEPFHPSIGIRQGDPLSPYLLIMCMEVLRALISEKCEAKLWNPKMASQGGITISHLFSADDLVLFVKADHKNCVAVKDALDTFCALSGQKVCATKSRVFFSPNVSPSAREALNDILEFCSTSSLGKYLGFPIKHVSIPQDFRAIIERMQNRLVGWKSHLLCFVGRLVLTQATLSTIPSYNM